MAILSLARLMGTRPPSRTLVFLVVETRRRRRAAPTALTVVYWRRKAAGIRPCVLIARGRGSESGDRSWLDELSPREVIHREGRGVGRDLGEVLVLPLRLGRQPQLA